MQDGDADRLMNLLAKNPWLLDRAPADAHISTAGDRGRLDEAHDCLRCGDPAEVPIVVRPPGRDENRWLDLCRRCLNWILRTATPEPLTGPGG